ncbi:hypothetical protein CUW_1979 [Turicibacter sanguinis PC909]|uniref:Uncharacterized protein n=1 Tax=Turicibacter sanguinis PC909 TaxID=702450 RepID=A0ABP2I2N0_9FIRM|nr:hypothetical protein CUW_1979 [Turicibacter sanguinis PC909]
MAPLNMFRKKIDKFFESYFRNLLFKKMIDDSQNFSSQF